ncbi:MAG: TolB family protein, partial [Gemmatimonadota bacterium]
MVNRGVPKLLVGVSAAVLLFVVSVAPLPGQTVNNGLTPHDIARIRTVSDAVVSPDGRHVAYLVSVPRLPPKEADGTAWHRLHVFDVNAGTSREYIGGDVNIGAIRWTPDGTSLMYLARRAGDDVTSLYAIPIGGGESLRILEHETGISGYALSPDGQRVAFLSPDPEDRYRSEMREKGFRQEVFEEDARFT